MGSFNTKPVETKTDHTNFKGAGCIFTNKISILAGYQPNKPIPHISGFGGKRKSKETFMHTALRETLEELFDMKNVPEHLIESIQMLVPPDSVLLQGDYILLVYSFRGLSEILSLVRQYISNVELYPRGFPTNVHELVMGRIIHPESEISHLCILPAVKNLKLDPLFLEDINILLR
jgi:hypothetical protein